MINLFLSVLVGVISGFLGSLIGSGGGIFLVPFLTLLCNVPIHKTIPASLMAVIATSTSGASSYIKQGITNIKLAFLLEVATTLGALTGSVIALLLSSWVLFLVFSLLLFYIAVSTFRVRSIEEKPIQKRQNVKVDALSRIFDIRDWYYDRALKRKVSYRVSGMNEGLALAFIAGVGSGLLGIGGGVIKVGAMNIFMNVPIKVAVGTSQLMLGVTASTSALLYLLAGLMDFDLIASLATGTIIGTFFGSRVMNRLRSRTIKWMIALLLGYLAYSMFAKGLLLGFGIEIPTLTRR
ncbi:sulfite exporter TauE/SafE family protein [Candidatus Bathyarchaeota archaeon]|nr:MAG: sulfite exporter TauE/SafE family protein [Candidatus Bathyarchaeota archaeon]